MSDGLDGANIAGDILYNAPDFTPPPPAPDGDGKLSQRPKLLSVIDRASFGWRGPRIDSGQRPR